MKNQEEIKSIKIAQRELADRLEALETEVAPKRKPQAGDVWKWTDNHHYIIDSLGRMTRIENGNYCNTGATVDAISYDMERLGTFKEVYMLRSEVEKDYVSKAQLQQWEEDDAEWGDSWV